MLQRSHAVVTTTYNAAGRLVSDALKDHAAGLIVDEAGHERVDNLMPLLATRFGINLQFFMMIGDSR